MAKRKFQKNKVLESKEKRKEGFPLIKGEKRQITRKKRKKVLAGRQKGIEFSQKEKKSALITNVLRISTIVLIGYIIALSAFYVQLGSETKKEEAKIVEDINKALDRAGKGLASSVPIAKISDVSQQTLILATSRGRQLQIWEIDPASAKAKLAQTVVLEDAISDATGTRAPGVNNSVQFKNSNDEIYIATGGKLSYNSRCLNRDGTCKWRIRKVARGTKIANLLYESEEEPVDWLLDQNSNTIMIFYLTIDKGKYVQIDSNDGRILKNIEFQRRTGASFAKMFFSLDGRYLFHVEELSEGHVKNQKLLMQVFEPANDKVSEINIFQGGNINADTNISADGENFAFFEGMTSPQKINIYNLARKTSAVVPNELQIQSESLFWSGDGKKLLYLTNEGPKFYDVEKNSINDIPGIESKIHYVICWGKANDYILYINEKGGISLYNFLREKANEIAVGSWDWIEGWSWK